MLSAVLIAGFALNTQTLSAAALVQACDTTEPSPSQVRWVMKRSGKWMRMASETSHLDKDKMWDGRVTDVVKVFRNRGKYTQVVFSRSSPSGDWFETAEHIYWPTGRLGCVRMRHYRIDYGGAVIDRWFSKTGKLEKREDDALNAEGDASTDAAVKERAKEFELGKSPVYMTTKSLPFARLAGL